MALKQITPLLFCKVNQTIRNQTKSKENEEKGLISLSSITFTGIARMIFCVEILQCEYKFEA